MEPPRLFLQPVTGLDGSLSYLVSSRMSLRAADLLRLTRTPTRPGLVVKDLTDHIQLEGGRNALGSGGYSDVHRARLEPDDEWVSTPTVPCVCGSYDIALKVAVKILRFASCGEDDSPEEVYRHYKVSRGIMGLDAGC